MAEQIPVTLDQKSPSWASIHPKVGVGLFAGAVTSFVLAIARSKFDIDLGGQETNLTIIITAIAGYLMPNAE